MIEVKDLSNISNKLINVSDDELESVFGGGYTRAELDRATPPGYSTKPTQPNNTSITLPPATIPSNGTLPVPPIGIESRDRQGNVIKIGPSEFSYTKTFKF